MKIRVNDRTFLLRKCTGADYWFVYRLLKSNMLTYFTKHLGGWKPSVFRSDFDKRRISIIEYKNRRVAFTDLEFENDFTYLRNIQLSKFVRRKGLGTVLLTLMEKTTKKRGIHIIRLRVFKENPAKRLYLRHGYYPIKDEGHTLVLEKKV
ncbi:GNAT family N-acetyltransferase [Candidatus Woesearchaeota archaeon]|nr:MAG: GNAT family N-acetyltransferase [Candidatus Woesearchaeota archaeon]